MVHMHVPDHRFFYKDRRMKIEKKLGCGASTHRYTTNILFAISSFKLSSPTDTVDFFYFYSFAYRYNN